MPALHVNHQIAITNPAELISETVQNKVLDSNSFYIQAQELKNYYSFVGSESNNEQKIVGFIQFHTLVNFLLWVHQPINDIFGHIKTTLHLNKCWDEEDYHLVLTLFSEKDNMDELTRLDDNLFSKLENLPEIDHILKYVVIAQR